MSESKKEGLDLSLVRRVLSLASPYRRELYTTIILSILLAGMAMVRPILVQRAIDYHIIRFDMPGLQRIVALMVLSLIVETIMRYYFGFLSVNACIVILYSRVCNTLIPRP